MAGVSPVRAAEAVPKATPRPRNLVLMLDGTSNQFSEHNSNLIKLMSVVKAEESQLLFYSSGVGELPPLPCIHHPMQGQERESGSDKSGQRPDHMLTEGTILPDSASTWGVVKQKTAAAIDLALAWYVSEAGYLLPFSHDAFSH